MSENRSRGIFLTHIVGWPGPRGEPAGMAAGGFTVRMTSMSANQQRQSSESEALSDQKNRLMEKACIDCVRHEANERQIRSEQLTREQHALLNNSNWRDRSTTSLMSVTMTTGTCRPDH